MAVSTATAVPETRDELEGDEALQTLIAHRTRHARDELLRLLANKQWTTAQQHVNALNKYLRTESSLPKKIQELAMLVTARENDCQYIWNAHAASARAAG